MLNYHTLPQAAPRMIKVDGRQWQIQTYDIDNGYPQRMLSLINASPTATACVNLFAKFIMGQGCRDKVFYKTPINGRNLTPDKLLRLIARDYGRFKGFAIHVNWDENYYISSVTWVPFQNCRIGIEPDRNNRIAIYSNWYNSVLGNNGRVYVKDVDYIWRFNPDPNEIQRQVDFSGGWDKYQGQIYYFSDEPDTYPLSPFDSVIDAMLAEIKSGVTTRKNLANNFSAKVLWVDKGKSEDEAETQQRNQMVAHFLGEDGAPAIRVDSEDATGADVPTITAIPTMLKDDIFEYSDNKIRGQIYRVLGMNPVLLADLTQGRYNQNQLPESQEYYNNLLQNERNIFEECFSEIFSLYKDDINPTKDYSIIPLATTTISVANDTPVNNA
jgi:hypothetical protein